MRFHASRSGKGANIESVRGPVVFALALVAVATGVLAALERSLCASLAALAELALCAGGLELGCCASDGFAASLCFVASAGFGASLGFGASPCFGASEGFVASAGFVASLGFGAS